jgi:hypothetical protein
MDDPNARLLTFLDMYNAIPKDMEIPRRVMGLLLIVIRYTGKERFVGLLLDAETESALTPEVLEHVNKPCHCKRLERTCVRPLVEQARDMREKEAVELKRLNVDQLALTVLKEYTLAIDSLLQKCDPISDSLWAAMNDHVKVFQTGKSVCVSCQMPTKGKCSSCGKYRYCQECWNIHYKSHLACCRRDLEQAVSK